MLRNRIAVLYSEVSLQVREAFGPRLADIIGTDDPIALKEQYRRLTGIAEADAVEKQQQNLLEGRMAANILEVFQQIRDGDVPDRPLWFEWNVWRALSMLDDGDIRNNFHMDRFGYPTTGASGRQSDIVCEYAGFHLAVEVTLSFGARQYDTEAEPVHRHVGRLQREKRDGSDDRPVFGLFIAERLHRSVVTHFFTLHRVPVREFGGPVSIVPLELEDFIPMVQAAARRLPIRSEQILAFFREARRLAEEAPDEEAWHEGVRELASCWPLAVGG
ncbi:MAG: AlwI family type II restriction endonuclease [Armatimonadetes bacterium]|nr:AlwI family type II restriction endonuclease [Armatimonadota bacterium]